MAQVALYHRKATPRKRDNAYSRLTEEQQKAVRVLSLCLRLAEALDRGHLGLIESVLLTTSRESGGAYALHPVVRAGSDASLEIWAIEGQVEAFHKTLGKPLVVARPSAPASSARGAVQTPRR